MSRSVMPKPPPADSKFWKVWEVGTRLNIALFRATKGRVGGKIPGSKARICIVHNVGRKSGQKRETPLIYLADGDNVVIVASKGGVDKHPAWFHNVMAMDAVEVELPGGGRKRMRPHVAEGAERARLWDALVGIYKPYADYQTYTSRQIPVVVLEPA